MVGRIHSYKGQLEAVRAVQIVRDSGVDVELVIVGGVDEVGYARMIADYVESHHLEACVRLLGFQDNPASYLALTDIALTCARNEAFGRTTVEAMLMGKPVIGANSGGTAEIIHDGETGLLYEPGDVSGLADRILWLQAHPEMLSVMGRRAATAARGQWR